jgi:AcrR family transcriptional regulator
MRKAKARLRRTKGLRSDSLLETALTLFAEEGYRDVTIQKIAKRLRIRHSLIYYYFESKEKLFHSALLHALEKLMAEYGDVRKRHQHPVDLINIMIDHASHDQRRTPRFVDDIVRDFYAFEQSTLADSIRQGVRSGIFKYQSPDEMAAFISRNIDGIYYGAIVRRDVSVGASMKKLRKIVWQLLDYQDTPRPRKGAANV